MDVTVEDLRRALLEVVAQDASQALKSEDGPETAADCLERLKERQGWISMREAQLYAPHGLSVVCRGGELMMITLRGN
jgi:hypothetical protein